MTQTVLIILSIFLCIWAGYSFYLIFKPYEEADDPIGIPTSLLLDLLIVVFSWLGEKFLSKSANIVLFKFFCLLWGLFLIGIMFLFWIPF